MPELAAADLEDILSRTESLWDEVRGGRIFISGGTGFIGSWLVDSFAHANSRLNLNARMVVLSRRSPPVSNPSIVFHRGDIRTFNFPGGAFSHVIHGANDAARHESPDLAEVITAGTARMVDFCQARGAKQLLYLSSGAVYGPQPQHIRALTEDYEGSAMADDARPLYGSAKRAAEDLCLNATGLQVRIARGFAFLGPRLPMDGFAAGAFLRNLLRAEPIQVSGNGRSVRSYLYTSDLSVWIWTILLRGAPGGIYNVGSDSPVTIQELAVMFADHASPRLPIRILGDPAAGESRYVPSIEKARRELGLQVTAPVDQAVRRTIDWYRSATASVSC